MRLDKVLDFAALVYVRLFLKRTFVVGSTSVATPSGVVGLHIFFDLELT